MNRHSKPLAIITIIICAVMFAAGLKPKGFRLHNDTSWLKDTNGISFGKLGIAFTPKTFNIPTPESLTIELALKIPRQKRNHLEAIFDLWNAQIPRHLELCQWDSTLMLIKSNSRYYKDGKMKLGKSVSPNKQHLIVITSQRNIGIKLFIDGKLERATSSFSLCDSGTALGNLSLGNSSSANNPWHGEIHEFAIYYTILDDTQVLARYQNWIKNQQLPTLLPAIAIFPFDERQGTIAHNHAEKSGDIILPYLLSIPQKQFLVPPWEDFSFEFNLFIDYAVNLAGFIPLGFFLAAFLWAAGGYGRRHSFLITLFTGTAMSVFFEIAQSYIPTRSSQMSDLLLNILGTLAGILLFKMLVRRFGSYPALRSILLTKRNQ